MENPNRVNIPSTIKDPNYRYFMPRMKITTQGTGGGVKTKIENMKEVAQALYIPPDYPLKFIGKELGTNVEIKNDNFLINGSHTAEKMQSVLDKFIDKYILCPSIKCKKPEIQIFIKKGEIRCRCNVCGVISKLDDKHKFSNHIKNFPPPDMKRMQDQEIADEKGINKAKKTIDKETSLKIKISVEKIDKFVKETKDENEIISYVEDMFNENKFEMEVRYFVLMHGLFNKNIYQQLQARIPVIKSIISKEQESTIDEAIYYLLGGLADLIFNKFGSIKDLYKYLPSIIYYLYLDDIVTEEFWVKYEIKRSLPSFNAMLYTKENEAKLVESAAEFTTWIESAPYDDQVFIETAHKKCEINSLSKTVSQSTEINIDDI